MPPANIQWQEPLVQDDEDTLRIITLPKSSAIRRVVKSHSLPCDAISSDSLLSQERPRVQVRRRKRRTHNHGFLSGYRALTAAFWLLAFLGIIYYQSDEQSPALSVESVAQEKDVVEMVPKDALPLFPANTTTASYLDDKAQNRRLRAEINDKVETNFAPKTDRDQVVHVIHTRFMQHQPDLVNLGLARLELLTEFTLRSLEKQTSRNFLWVIRTDPALNASLRDPLIEALSRMENHLLIASNDNPNVQINEIVNVDPERVWSGDWESARKYLQQPVDGGKSRRILESRLDADDGLHFQFIEHLQDLALEELPNAEPAQWKIWCALRHMEWQYHSVVENLDTSSGILLSLKDRSCVSAGLTIGYTEGLKVHNLPPIKHQQLASKLPSCTNQDLKCLDFIQLLPSALRARTPTSAGMMNVLLGSKEKVDGRYVKGAKKQAAVQEQLWAVVESRFGFSQDNGSHLRNYVKDHLQTIAMDNLRGQCSDGHSCKKSSKMLLQAIIDNPKAFQ